MIQDIYQKAIKFAGKKHYDQKVTGMKANYLLHISNVAMEVLSAYCESGNFDLNYAIQLALLHDTIEDTDTTFDEIKEEFGEKVAVGVKALTKDSRILNKKARMRDSLNRINDLSDEVGLVKLADRITNLQAPPDSWDSQKIKYYLEEAKIISKILQNKNDYLNKRLEMKILAYQKSFTT